MSHAERPLLDADGGHRMSHGKHITMPDGRMAFTVSSHKFASSAKATADLSFGSTAFHMLVNFDPDAAEDLGKNLIAAAQMARAVNALSASAN
ncbi:hypothetical protein P3G55_17430 [Leptospira sp. 96542]|nr:hypothetical protein [Leptospira sp. 96542]